MHVSRGVLLYGCDVHNDQRHPYSASAVRREMNPLPHVKRQIGCSCLTARTGTASLCPLKPARREVLIAEQGEGDVEDDPPRPPPEQVTMSATP